MSASSPLLLVVCGLHRSGTTFAGEILKRAGVCVIHEPLNQRFGMVGIPIAYPFSENSNGVYAPLLDDAVNFARPWNKDVSHIGATGWKRRLYSLTGGRSGLRWERVRLLRSVGLQKSKVCLKDPFMSLATPYLVREKGIRVICLIRHPAAIHYSTAKQNWRLDIENLIRQPELMEKYGNDISAVHWTLAKENAAASIAILWKLMVRINTQLHSETGLKLVTHEALCLEPVETASQICSHFGIPFTPKLERYVLEHSGGARVEAIGNRTHDFVRNSQAIPDAWRGRLNAYDEAVMREIVGEEVISYYGQW